MQNNKIYVMLKVAPREKFTVERIYIKNDLLVMSY